MSFLAPLYLLGAAAIALPILFHMIRRTPRGRREFSSVMFLEPSPPRVTRRSRIEHWLLLCLRALALGLLAAAFARPFFREPQRLPLSLEQGRDVVLLIDRSASMRREGLWEAAVQRTERVLDQLGPADRAAVMTFGERAAELLGFPQWDALDPGQRRASAQAAVEELSPTWEQTDLGRALIDAAERLDAEATRQSQTRLQQVILISDLQAGSRLDALQSYDWPARITVHIEPVGEDVSPSNAGLSLMLAPTDSAAAADQQTRVRILNADDAVADRFLLSWQAAGHPPDPGTTPIDPPSGNRLSLLVPPGESRVVTSPLSDGTPDETCLLLEGDDHPFDNRCYVARRPPKHVKVVLIAPPESFDNPQARPYYITRALPDTPQRIVELQRTAPSDPPGTGAHLCILMAAVPDAATAALKDYVHSGGTVLVAIADPAEAAILSQLAGVPPADASEETVADYAMLTDLDFTHPLFAPLAQPRYSDFTKVHFWKYRRIDCTPLPGCRVLATFDGGAVAIGEFRVGSGRVVFFTSGWHPSDSQLAVSTKFVPMLNGLVDDVAGIVDRPSSFRVGERISLEALAGMTRPNSRESTTPHASGAAPAASPVAAPEGELSTPDRGGVRHVTRVRLPSGAEQPIPANAVTFDDTAVPGRYQALVESGESQEWTDFCVNLSPDESRTSPLADDALPALGVRLSDGVEPVRSTTAEVERQLRARELEGQQKLWRWVVLTALVVLLLETWLAGRAARHRPVPTP